MVQRMECSRDEDCRDGWVRTPSALISGSTHSCYTSGGRLPMQPTPNVHCSTHEVSAHLTCVTTEYAQSHFARIDEAVVSHASYMHDLTACFITRCTLLTASTCHHVLITLPCTVHTLALHASTRACAWPRHTYCHTHTPSNQIRTQVKSGEIG